MILWKKEIKQIRKNGIIHREVFEHIKPLLVAWENAANIDKQVEKICKKHGVDSAFRWFHGYPNYSCINVNDVVVHGIPHEEIVFADGDLVTFDFWVKDKNLWLLTDAAFSVVIGWDDKNPIAARMVEASRRALLEWIKHARAGNRVWDIWFAIQSEIQEAGFKIIRELTGHGLWTNLHDKPYIYNYGRPWTWDILKKWMLVAIEPIIWETSGQITDEWSWEIYIKDWSLGCQYEHTVLITDGDPEIIV
jgi:methionyl aminopeptidase